MHLEYFLPGEEWERVTQMCFLVGAHNASGRINRKQMRPTACAGAPRTVARQLVFSCWCFLVSKDSHVALSSL